MSIKLLNFPLFHLIKLLFFNGKLTFVSDIFSYGLFFLLVPHDFL